jgi:hypothetical protein
LRLPLPDETDRLAGESTANKVNSRPWSAEPPFDAGSDVVMPGHLRPVFREDTPAVRVDLDLPDDGHTGAF